MASTSAATSLTATTAPVALVLPLDPAMLAALDVPEILEHVLSHLADDAPALLAASLVSRAWSRVAVARLWRDGPADTLVRLFTVSAARRAHYAALLRSLTLKLRHANTLSYVRTAGFTYPQLRALAVEFTLPYSANDDAGVRHFIEHAVWDRGAGNSPLTALSLSCFCSAGLGRATVTAELFALLAARCPRLTSLVLDGIFVGRDILQGIAIECRRPDACTEVGCCRNRSQQHFPRLQRLTLGIPAAAAPVLGRLLPPTLTALNIQIGPHISRRLRIHPPTNPTSVTNATPHPGSLTILGGPVDDADHSSMGQGERNGTAASHIAEAVARRTPGMRELQVQWCHASIPLAALSAFELLPRLAVLRLGKSSTCSTDHSTVAAAPGFTNALLERLLAGQPLLRQLSLALTAPLSPAALEVVGRSCRMLEQLKIVGTFDLYGVDTSISAGRPAGWNATGQQGETVYDAHLDASGPTLFPKLAELALTAV